MKLNIPKEWFENKANLEEGEIGAGNPNFMEEYSKEYAQQTIDEIIAILKHLGADLSDINEHPLAQIIGREFSILKNRNNE